MATTITKSSISFVERLIKKQFDKAKSWNRRKELINIANSYGLKSLASEMLTKSF